MNKKTVEVKRNYCTCEKYVASVWVHHLLSPTFLPVDGKKAKKPVKAVSSSHLSEHRLHRFSDGIFENCRRDRAKPTRSTFFRARHKKGGEGEKGGARRKSPPSPPFTPFHWPFWKSVMDGYAQDHKTVGFCVGKRVKTASTLARTGPPRHFLGCGLTESTTSNLRFKIKTLEVT